MNAATAAHKTTADRWFYRAAKKLLDDPTFIRVKAEAHVLELNDARANPTADAANKK